jgi:hypothetical protein
MAAPPRVEGLTLMVGRVAGSEGFDRGSGRRVETKRGMKKIRGDFLLLCLFDFGKCEFRGGMSVAASAMDLLFFIFKN